METPEVIPPERPRLPAVAQLALLGLGLAAVAGLLALGMPRRVLEADGTTPAPKPDDDAPPDTHNGGHHDPPAPDPVAAAELEAKLAARLAPAPPADPKGAA